MKCYFLMMALIIPNKESTTNGNVYIHVYWEPLIEKIQMFWKGVMTFDAHQGVTFSLKEMCMWNIHNFLAYGLFARCVTKGWWYVHPMA